MIMARTPPHAIPALFVWREQAEIVRLQEQREALIARIDRLRPHSHARIALQTRLQQLTAAQLALQTRVGMGDEA